MQKSKRKLDLEYETELIEIHGQPKYQYSSSIEFYNDRNEVYVTFELRNNKDHKRIMEFVR